MRPLRFPRSPRCPSAPRRFHRKAITPGENRRRASWWLFCCQNVRFVFWDLPNRIEKSGRICSPILLPHKVGTKSLESGLAAVHPTAQDDEKSALIAHVISPIMHVCQLFLSNVMHFVLLCTLPIDLWHNRLLLELETGRRSLDEPAGRGTEISHPRAFIPRANRYRLRTDSHSRRHRRHHSPRPRSAGERRSAGALARWRSLAHFDHQFSTFL